MFSRIYYISLLFFLTINAPIVNYCFQMGFKQYLARYCNYSKINCERYKLFYKNKTITKLKLYPGLVVYFWIVKYPHKQLPTPRQKRGNIFTRSSLIRYNCITIPSEMIILWSQQIRFIGLDDEVYQ